MVKVSLAHSEALVDMKLKVFVNNYAVNRTDPQENCLASKEMILRGSSKRKESRTRLHSYLGSDWVITGRSGRMVGVEFRSDFD